MSIFDEFTMTLKDAADRLGVELSEDMDAVRGYAEERARHLASIYGEAGFEQALLAERDNVALKAGTDIVTSADAADGELRGIILGALAIMARALV